MSTNEYRTVPAWISRTAWLALLAVASFAGGCATLTASANQDCSTADNRSWVQGDGECLYIYTFDHEKKVPAPTLLVFLHGDKSSGSAISWEPKYAHRFASTDVVAISMLRPGYPAEDGNRSSGDRSRFDHYTEHNITAVAGALRRLKEYHKARRMILIGYSGGAAMTGVIIGKFPGLVNVAVLIACPCNFRAWRGAQSRWRNSLPPSDYIDGIAADTRVLALTGQRDTNTDERLGRDYVAKLKARNLAAEFRQIPDGDHSNAPHKPETLSAIKELLKP
jgi:pimeloyl-ACP methyl ester carboxylesterase